MILLDPLMNIADYYCSTLTSSLSWIEWEIFAFAIGVVTAIWIREFCIILYFVFLSNNYFNLTKDNLSALEAYVYLVIHNEQTDCRFHKLGPFEMFQCFYYYQFDGFADVIINGHLKGENAISWSKGDINEFSKGVNYNKMCDFDEYDIFTVQHWDLVWFIPLWNAKSIYLFRKLLPLYSIKLNLNLVTKLKLLSIVNITNIDITLYLVKTLQAEYLKQLNSYDVT